MLKVSTFAQRLQELIDLKRITKAQLARDAGIDKSSITHYVKGDWEGKDDAVFAIASVLNVSAAWLKGYDVPMENPTWAELPVERMTFVDKTFEISGADQELFAFEEYLDAMGFATKLELSLDVADPQWTLTDRRENKTYTITKEELNQLMDMTNSFLKYQVYELLKVCDEKES